MEDLLRKMESMMRDEMNYRQVKEMGKVLREIVLYRIVIITLSH